VRAEGANTNFGAAVYGGRQQHHRLSLATERRGYRGGDWDRLPLTDVIGGLAEGYD